MDAREKSEVMRSLRGEGRFAEFKEAKEARRMSGMSNNEAYEATLEEFEAYVDNHEDREERRRVHNSVFEGKSSTLREDIQWVYQHAEASDVTPEMAPSGGAWGLFCWVRENQANRSHFYTKLLPMRSRLEVAEPKDPVEDAKTEDLQKLIERVDALGDQA